MRIKMLNTDRNICFFLALAVGLNILFWFSVRDIQGRWLNVPPVPELKYAEAYGLGDSELSYRMIGLMIQNLGETGGRSISLKDYNYESLSQWFFLEDHLNPRSNFIPYLAAFYFSNIANPEKMRPVIDYLLEVGQRAEGQKWRWLAQAVFLARFKMQDMDRALELAHVLAAVDNPEMPGWARQMPAFVMNAKGEKDAAYALMVEILKSRASELHPNEVTNMRYYICDRLLEKKEAHNNPLCENLP
jgi:hypothetical protein